MDWPKFDWPKLVKSGWPKRDWPKSVSSCGVLSSEGEPHPHAADVDGAVLLEARRDKERTYPEVVAARSCRLVVVAIETGGMWSEEAVEFTTQLAFAKAREVPAYMHWPAVYAWQRRWTRMLSTVCALSFAASLVGPPAQCESWCWTWGEAPHLAELFSQDPR